MTNSWMDPVFFEIGPLQVRWYGLMYVIAFAIGSYMVSRLQKSGFWPLSKEAIDKYVTAVIIGMFLGARTFYVFIYNWDYYSSHLIEIFHVWRGGLSFHGAVVGMVIASAWFARKHNTRFLIITDCLAVVGPQGLFFGRMGNMINGELYGRVTTSPFGIIFPGAGPYPRHPSQLYEGLLEGLLLAVIVWVIHKKQQYYGKVGAAFVFGYGFFRFLVEFFREPDSQLGYYFGFLTMGQILCFIMMMLGGLVYVASQKQKIKVPTHLSGHSA